MNGRPRWLPLLAALTLVAAACGNDSRAQTEPGGRERAAAGATGSTLVTDDANSAADPASAAGSAVPSPSTSRPARGTMPTTASGIAKGAATTTMRASPTTTGQAVSAISSTTTLATSDPHAPGPCPDARTCTERKLHGGRWPRDDNGLTTIHYRVNPTNRVRPQFSDNEFIAAVRAAFQTWADAVPNLRFVYDGTTTERPTLGDGRSNNVVGFGPLAPVVIAETSYTPHNGGPTYTGFSITIQESRSFSHRPCDPPRGEPCTDDDNVDMDLQGVVTHEVGHVIGLDHPKDIDAAYQQTMCGCGSPNGRSQSSLARGDVIGARELTGTPKTVPMPTIYWP